MTYPSIISQPGSASRNVEPIADALADLISRRDTNISTTQRVLEIGSFPYDHILHFARRWPDVHWEGSVRDTTEQGGVEERIAKGEIALPANLAGPRLLDIANPQHWSAVRDATATKGPFDGVVFINIIHCTPPDFPPRIFEALSTRNPLPLLSPSGWVATYGPFLDDDGNFKSPSDAKVRQPPRISVLIQFDAAYIRGQSASLGLRSIKSISEMASSYGFEEAERREMPKGNMWVVWRPKPSSGAA